LILGKAGGNKMERYKLELGFGLANGFEVGCPDCGYREMFFMGTSLFEVGKDFLESLDPENRAAFEELLKDAVVVQKISEKRLYKCPSCGSFALKRYARVQYDTDKTLETRFECHRCRKLMKPVKHIDEIRGVACPKCKAGSIEITQLIHWD
jgi:DNA-directed RNA polymerase subunit RPC12/RpoP